MADATDFEAGIEAFQGIRRASESSSLKGLANRQAVIDSIAKQSLLIISTSAIVIVFFIIWFLFQDGFPAFLEIPLNDFFLGADWRPRESELYGTFPLIFGTIAVSIGAMLFAIPLGLCGAIFIAELAPPKVRDLFKSSVEILAGIPSVVYGYFGMVILSQFLRISFRLTTGDSWLAGSILLGVMALPTIVSVSEDAISAVPTEFKEASLAMGATKWQTISKVIVPSAFSGITAAIILGMGRAIGETMAVLMVTGNSPKLPSPILNIFDRLRTITGTLGIETGEVPLGSVHYHALFALGMILFAMVLIINISSAIILEKMSERFYPKKKEAKTAFFDNLEDLNKFELISRKVIPILATGGFTTLFGALLGEIFFGNLLADIVCAIIAGMVFLITVIIWLKKGREVAIKVSIILVGGLLSPVVGYALGILFFQGALAGLTGTLILSAIFWIIIISWLITNHQRTALKLGGFALGTVFAAMNGGLLLVIVFVALIILLFFVPRYINTDFSPKKKEKIAFNLIKITVAIIMFILGVLLFYIIARGIFMGGLIIDIPHTIEFLTQPPSKSGRLGGIFPAITGTLALILGALIVAIPLGGGAGIYLAEYARKDRFTRIIRLGIDNLNGTPSIVFGLFGFAFFVLVLRWGISLLAGMLTLGFLILPTVIRTTEEAIKAVPMADREASYAMGAGRFQTIWKVVLPQSIPGIITGVILSIGRAAGETAPIMFVAATLIQRNPLPPGLFEPVMALPFHLYMLSTYVPGASDNAAGTALVLLAIILVIFAIANYMRIRSRKKR
ncbi:MAG: phosphate ABC transporter permease subunit PstC [Promethearchaeota archaeon]